MRIHYCRLPLFTFPTSRMDYLNVSSAMVCDTESSSRKTHKHTRLKQVDS